MNLKSTYDTHIRYDQIDAFYSVQDRLDRLTHGRYTPREKKAWEIHIVEATDNVEKGHNTSENHLFLQNGCGASDA